jgi:hypothetical protein
MTRTGSEAFRGSIFGLRRQLLLSPGFKALIFGPPLALKPLHQQRLQHQSHLRFTCAGVACLGIDLKSVRCDPAGTAGNLIVFQTVGFLNDVLDPGVGRAKSSARQELETVGASPKVRA